MSGSHHAPGAQTGPDGPGEEIGSVAEEAAKLLGALAGAARERGTDLGAGFAGLAGHAERVAREAADHVRPAAADADDVDGADGAEHAAHGECTWCPLCRTVHLVRQTSPEVRAHLASAVTSLARAAAGFLATTVPEEARSPRVDHIDLDDDGGWPADATDHEQEDER